MLAAIALIAGELAGLRFVAAVAPAIIVDGYSVAAGLLAVLVASGAFLVFMRMEQRIRSPWPTVLGLLAAGLVLAALCATGLCLFAHHAFDGLDLN